MKKKYILILISALLFNFFGCALDDIEKPVKLRGIITNSEGKPIDGVKVESTSIDNSQFVTSDAGGKYELIAPKGGAIKFTFSKTGYTSQSFEKILVSGEEITQNVTLNLLSEDAFLIAEPNEITVKSYGGKTSFYVNANVIYNLEYEQNSWFTINGINNYFEIEYEDNFNVTSRSAAIIVKGEFNLSDTVHLFQKSGPPLILEDYIGKDNKTSIPGDKPFFSFSKEVSVISCTMGGAPINYEFSSDKKTVLINEYKLNLLSPKNLSIKVRALDGDELSYEVPLQLYINVNPMTERGEQKVMFTKDQKYLWILAREYPRSYLYQYSTSDYKLIKKIDVSDLVIYGSCYNPYNNTIYLASYRYYQNRVVFDMYLYNADTGDFIKSMTIDEPHFHLYDIAFADDGFGLITSQRNLYSFDSANDHKLEPIVSGIVENPYQTNTIIPQKIKMANKGQNFIMIGGDGTSTYRAYSMDNSNKSIKQISSGQFDDFVTFSESSYVIYFTKQYYTTISFQNIITRVKSNISISKPIWNGAMLYSENDNPVFLTSDLRLISLKESREIDFKGKESYFIGSSNDGKYVHIVQGNSMYLFRSEIFTKYLDFIQY